MFYDIINVVALRNFVITSYNLSVTTYDIQGATKIGIVSRKAKADLESFIGFWGIVTFFVTRRYHYGLWFTNLTEKNMNDDTSR